MTHVFVPLLVRIERITYEPGHKGFLPDQRDDTTRSQPSFLDHVKIRRHSNGYNQPPFAINVFDDDCLHDKYKKDYFSL